jgi:hypothetical protein
VPTPTGRKLRVVERVGCDPAPVDPTTAEGRLRLTSYVWPDQADRLRRLRGALDVAAEVPAELYRQDAADLMAGLQLRAGTCTVLWHSFMWQYVDGGQQAVVQQNIARLADSAETGSPFVHVRLEPMRRRPGSDHEFLVAAEQWPATSRTSAEGVPSTVLGAAAAHGLPVTWER